MKKEKRTFDTTTRSKAIGFLVWFRNQYNHWTSDTYYKIAEKYGQANYVTCRTLLKELVEAGYLREWNPGTRQRRFYLNLERYNELVFPYVFHKDGSGTESSK